jgi:hypothetical protein
MADHTQAELNAAAAVNAYNRKYPHLANTPTKPDEGDPTEDCLRCTQLTNTAEARRRWLFLAHLFDQREITDACFREAAIQILGIPHVRQDLRRAIKTAVFNHLYGTTPTNAETRAETAALTPAGRGRFEVHTPDTQALREAVSRVRETYTPDPQTLHAAARGRHLGHTTPHNDQEPTDD